MIWAGKKKKKKKKKAPDPFSEGDKIIFLVPINLNESIHTHTHYFLSLGDCLFGNENIDPISTLPEHLHSTFPSHAKLRESTLTKKKTFLFPL